MTGHNERVRGALIVGALGVVFGDIGTSPIYTVQTIFSPDDPHPVTATTTSVYGLVSLIVWSVTLVVTVTYVLLVTRADNNGEGGIMALITLIRRRGVPGGRHTKYILASLGVFGAALFFGDSMITPAISVLSAVEEVKVVQPSLHEWVVPITVVIIVILFASQRFGSAAVGRLFGPVMLVWFAAIGACGINGIRYEPEVLKALSPTYALGYLFGHFGTAFFALATVVLAITGAEALYADMGHFGRPAITRGWLGLVFPACVLSYLGQAALVLHDPESLRSPFFLLVPHVLRLGMVVLATAATVIASQSVISGAFSVTHQAIQLSYLPRLRINHTSTKTIGQVYVPLVNWTLMVAVVTLVVTVGSTMLSLELLFLGANLTKLIHGAWLPLLIGVALFTVMTTWQRGRALVTAHRREMEGPLQGFVDDLHRDGRGVRRVPGTAIFLNRGKETTPLALRANVQHNHVLHQQVVILSVQTDTVPYVPDADRIVVDALGHDDGIIHVTATVGYAEATDVPRILALVAARDPEGTLDLRRPSYFLSTIDLSIDPAGPLPAWRQRLFLATSLLTADAAESFGLPLDQTIIIGSRITV